LSCAISPYQPCQENLTADKEHLNKRKNLKLTRIKINEKIKKELESLGYLY